MHVSLRGGPDAQVIMDYMSSHGPTVTHLRGTILMNSLDILKRAGHYEQYLELLDPKQRDPILFAIASSWVSIDVAEAHYDACDRLQLSDEELRLTGELTAKRVAETFLGTALRTMRKAGVESYWQVVKQSDRLWDRGYQGGGCTVIQAGPKDVTVEWHGVPLAAFQYFRSAQRAYQKALAELFCNVAVVKPVSPREPHPHRLATSISWV